MRTLVQTGALAAAGCTYRRNELENLWEKPFRSVPDGSNLTHHVSPDLDANIILRWGDPVLENAPAWAPGKPNPEAQSLQFGYNNDYLALFENGPDRFLLVANHEYVNPEMMFAARYRGSNGSLAHQMAAVGLSVVELVRTGSSFVPTPSPLARRISATTPIELSGPAANSALLCTSADSEGMKVLGTFGNCAGGVTPWGTVLSCEENFQSYFRYPEKKGPIARRYRLGSGRVQWHVVDSRFNYWYEPHESNRFGWVVEVDPWAPKAAPIKRTALGRFAHESAELILSPDNRVVVYLGDDAPGEFLYRFVSDERWIGGQTGLQAGKILDSGTLSVAQFSHDGKVRWLPLRPGIGQLVESNGFSSLADIVVNVRVAASLVGATPLDRPEDVQPLGEHVWVALTGHGSRPIGQKPVGSVVPFARMGQILRLTSPDGDHTAEYFRWEVILSGGNVWKDSDLLAGPDNLAHDPGGRLLIATDQGRRKSETGSQDALYRMDDQGRVMEEIFRGPLGSEICGPCLSPDNLGVWLSVQHPGAGGTWSNPTTRWPDFDPSVPPRPAVVALTPRS